MADVAALQAFLRTSAGRGRRVLRAGPFTVTIHPHDALRFINYAIPDDGARPDGAAVDALRDAFRAHDRLPRLEWIEEAAPEVAPALADAGMTEELRTPLMACSPSELVSAEGALDGLVVAVAGDADLRDLARLQRVAFGEEPPAADEIPPDPRRGGGGAVLARVGREAVAAAGGAAGGRRDPPRPAPRRGGGRAPGRRAGGRRGGGVDGGRRQVQRGGRRRDRRAVAPARPGRDRDRRGRAGRVRGGRGPLRPLAR